MSELPELENDAVWLRMARDSWKRQAELANERANKNEALLNEAIKVAENAVQQYQAFCAEMKGLLKWT